MFHQDPLSPLGMGAESEERPQQKSCYRPGDETGRLGMEERRKSEDLKLAYLFAGLLASLADLADKYNKAQNPLTEFTGCSGRALLLNNFRF